MNTQSKASKWHNKPSKTFGTAVCLELEMHTLLVLYQIFFLAKSVNILSAVTAYLARGSFPYPLVYKFRQLLQNRPSEMAPTSLCEIDSICSCPANQYTCIKRVLHVSVGFSLTCYTRVSETCSICS